MYWENRKGELPSVSWPWFQKVFKLFPGISQRFIIFFQGVIEYKNLWTSKDSSSKLCTYLKTHPVNYVRIKSPLR